VKSKFEPADTVIRKIVDDYNKGKIPIPYIKREGYFMSFHWFLDLVVLISLFPDVPLIADSTVFGSLVNNGFTQTGRAVRLLRLTRLVRIYRILYEREIRHRYVSEEDKFTDAEVIQPDTNSIDEFDYAQHGSAHGSSSRLGTQLLESTSRRIILLILITLLVLPFLDYEFPDTVEKFSVQYIQQINLDASLSDKVRNELVNGFIDEFKSRYEKILYLSVSSISDIPIVNDVKLIQETRDVALTSEYLSYYNESTSTSYTTHIQFSELPFLQLNSILIIVLTVFIGFLLIAANTVFGYDIQNLVLKPIEVSILFEESLS
jgi:hypothetical protein